jgi:hypothetical protein
MFSPVVLHVLAEYPATERWPSLISTDALAAYRPCGILRWSLSSRMFSRLRVAVSPARDAWVAACWCV